MAAGPADVLHQKLPDLLTQGRQLLLSKSGSEIFITLLLSAVVSGMTVGGKACGKSLAMNSSTAVVRTAAKVLCFFRTLPQRLEKKSAKK